jgi:GT2 family glycosyltransferase
MSKSFLVLFFKKEHAFSLPPRAPGSWCEVRAQASGGRWWAKLHVTGAGGLVVGEVFLGPQRLGVRKTLMRMPPEAAALSLLFMTDTARLAGVRVRVLSRSGAALRLLLGGWLLLPGALRGDRFGLPGRVRAVLGQAQARRGEAPPYDVWLAVYEDRTAEGDAAAADLQVAVVTGDAPALAATLASAPPGTLIIAQAADWDRLSARFVLLLGAGEVLAPHAVARFAQALAQTPHATFLCADTDELDARGRRSNPLFKPQPGPVFLESGLLTQGACVFRRGADWNLLPMDANEARLILARQAVSEGQAQDKPGAMLRIPAILTHLPAAVKARPSVPVVSAGDAKISIIIPSSCRSAHVLHCLRAVSGSVAGADVEILLAVSSIDAGDRRQAACLARAQAVPGVRVLDLALPAFNYAEVNNRAAAQARGEFLLLLNDDVVPVTKNFLSLMLSHARTPGVGAVGARLLYGNDTVQHAGVILGLAGLCEHAGRHTDASDPGDHGRARMDREVSAVTAACLLLPASLFAELGGFDRGFAVALNDVDLCLRIRATGARIVYTASATLYHYESLTLGRHYQGIRASLEALEVQRLRARWAAQLADDPYYNQQASLEPGREWQPAFPPRLVQPQHCNFAKRATKC